MDEHIHWRRDFHPSDKPVVSAFQFRSDPAYRETLIRTEEALLELSSRLKGSSMPTFSPRYLGHMMSDTLMSANLGYLATILYNPNNCSYEASTEATVMELEVGRQLAALFGFNPTQAWGHITAGGTIANYEALWLARNLKSVPTAVQSTCPEYLTQEDCEAIPNLPPERILQILEAIKSSGRLNDVRKHTIQYTGINSSTHPGKLLLPCSKHYSWSKAADILGIGQDSIIQIPVLDNFRMDLKTLEKTVYELIAQKVPILAIVAVVGTTESGAVDEVHKIAELKEKLQQENRSFYLHLDAAYGGYVRSTIRNPDSDLIPFDLLKDYLHSNGDDTDHISWPNADVYAALKAMNSADSITVDPHKLGYVPYSAGGIVLKDRRLLDLISYYASYVFEQEDMAEHLGSFILEGSKPGASAASVWMAHKVVPLDIRGYGKLIAYSIYGAQKLYKAIIETPTIEVQGRRFRLAPLMPPDLNVVNYAFNLEGNTSLDTMDELNRNIYKLCSYHSGPVYKEDFIVSKTVLERSIYKDAPLNFLNRLGIPETEWKRAGKVLVIRSCVMTPYLTVSNQTFKECWADFISTMKNNLIQATDHLYI